MLIKEETRRNQYSYRIKYTILLAAYVYTSDKQQLGEDIDLLDPLHLFFLRDIVRFRLPWSFAMCYLP